MPDRFELSSFPNPFNPQVTVRYELPWDGQVDISIFDVTGRKVVRLEAGYRRSGTHTLTWDGVLDDGRRVASGTYLLRVETGVLSRTVKMAYVQ